MHYLHKTPRLVGQVLLVVFLLAVLGAQVVSAQNLPPCTELLVSELPDDGDGVPQAMDVDKNDNGLIEICDLEGLYEMRYAPDGSGYSTSPTDIPNNMGCRSGGNCIGFELMKSLNFTSNASYRSPDNRMVYTAGSGWQRIGTPSSPFNTRFEGNGHTISRLMINRRTADSIGLFGVTDTAANIANIGLLNVRIIGSSSAGGLVGGNSGSITNSYATGSVSGNFSVGVLVGSNFGIIMNSYATGFVSGNFSAGVLVGGNSGSITNSYATGPVSGNEQVGGLVGGNSGSITNSYATGPVSGNEQVGGLVGSNVGVITNSYATGFNILVGLSSGSSTVTNSSTQTIMALETPTSPTGIYSGWSTDVWDFGTPNDRPTLKNNPEIEVIRIRAKVFLEGPLQ